MTVDPFLVTLLIPALMHLMKLNLYLFKFVLKINGCRV